MVAFSGAEYEASTNDDVDAPAVASAAGVVAVKATAVTIPNASPVATIVRRL